VTDPEIAPIVELIDRAERIVLTSHIQPDGDAVGSTLALLRALKAVGKKTWAIIPSHIPYGLRFILAGDNEIIRYDPRHDDRILEEADLFIMIDCAGADRAGNLGAKIVSLPQPLIVVDHHSTNRFFGTLNYVIPGASSTGALIMNILDALEVELTLDLALPLYVAIVTDTGNFNYPGTTQRTHEKAGRLLAAGVQPYEVHRKLALDRSSAFMRLAGIALLTAQVGYEGKIAYSVIHHDLYRRFTPRLDELPALPVYLLTVRGIEVGILFLEYEPGKILIELRSQGLVNVAEVAKLLGGGGHAGAAGARVRGEAAGVIYRTLTEVDARLRRARDRENSEEHRSEVWRKA